MRSRSPWAPPAVPFTAADVHRSHEFLHRAIRDGIITRLRRGVYIATTAVPDDAAGQHLLQAMALQRSTVGLVASHETAALGLGLRTPSDFAPDRAEPRFVKAPQPGDRSTKRPRCALRPIPRGHITTLPSGLTVTSAARTAVDIAAEQSLPEALVTVDHVLRIHTVELIGERRIRQGVPVRVGQAAMEPMYIAAEVATPRGRRGRVAQTLAVANPARESATESLSAGYFFASDLPQPNIQFPIMTDEEVFYADFAWPEFGVIGESDGLGKYQGEEVARERDREEKLRELGWVVVRWLYRDIVRRPGWVIEMVRRALRAGDWRG